MLKQKEWIRESTMQRASRIAIARSNAGLSLRKLANEIGVANQTYIDIENGVRDVKVGVLESIAKCTHANLYWLLTGRGKPRQIKRKKDGI